MFYAVPRNAARPAAVRRMRSALAVLTIFVVGLAVVGCGPDASADAANQRGYRGIVFDPPLPKPDFTLTDTEGEPFDFRRETEDKLALLFIGFTHCPDICPVHMANIAAVLDQMPEVAARTEVVFITADPERDTPERLRDWLNAFDRGFVGLRGTSEEVHRIEDALHLARSIVPDTAAEEYTVGHAAQVIAFSPDGSAHVVYPFGTRQEDWAHDLPRLLNDIWEES